MADNARETLPQEAQEYIDTINLQIASITGIGAPQTDYEYALVDQVAALQELKRLVIADPSVVAIERPLKRELEDTEDISTTVEGPPAKRQRVFKLLECSTCLERFSRKDTMKLKCCRTTYCIPCIQEWFTTALASKQLPKCCEQGIVPSEYRTKFTTANVAQYKAVVKEVEAERKLWCANENCRAFIKVDKDVSDFVSCSRCRRKTCASCSESPSAHKGRNKVCPNYLEDEVLESTISANKWKRCPECHVAVEKTYGCNNIRCTCGIMFCFRCGVSKVSESGRCECAWR